MREIKFRAWVGNKMYTAMPIEILGDNATTVNRIFACFPEITWMQFTELKDKNGKEIYEGDIVENWGGDDGLSESMEIIFDDMGQWFWGRSGNNIPLYELDSQESLIIGNIYENPELISN